MKILIFEIAILVVSVVESTPLCIDSVSQTNRYCFFYKQIDLNKNSNEYLIKYEPSSHLTVNSGHNKFNFKISSIHTEHQVEAHNLPSDKIFEFTALNSSFIQLKLDKAANGYSLINKTIKFKLYQSDDEKSKCYLVIDFIQSADNNAKIESVTYYETLQYDTISLNEVSIDLKTVIPDLICTGKPYSVTCLRCNLSPETSASSSHNSLALSIDNDILSLKFDTFKSSNIYRDVYLLVSEEIEADSVEQSAGEQFYLLVRIFNLNGNLSDFRDSLIFKIERRQRRFSKKNAGNSSAPAIVNKNQNGGASLHHHNSNFNLLKTAQLAITEEAVGLQTKLKIYDYVWMDYQLNASDYVRQRIQLIAPDNPILNITKPFDFETGGPIHNFQIIFTRKVDKRTIKDIKPITIKIIDVNDEPPVWRMDEPVPYTAVVERDPRPGQLVFQFVADDPDTQSQIVYTLHSKSPNTTRLVMKDGKIFTEAGPPFMYDTYKILVSAYDARAANAAGTKHVSAYNQLSNKSQEIFAELTVIVGKKAPQFYQSEYKVNISENAPIGSSVVQMRAKSFNPDPFNKKHLRYSLQTRQGQSAEFSIYSENGTVTLARKVNI